MQEVETVLEYCKHKDCVHRGELNGGGTPYCGYILDTGHPRGCEISKCNKYEKGKKRNPKMNKETHIDWEIVCEEN